MMKKIKTKIIVDGEKAICTFGLRNISAKPMKCSNFTLGASRAPVTLPPAVDLREHMTEVEDQSNSNSCSANAIAGAYEYLCKKEADASGDDIGVCMHLLSMCVSVRAHARAFVPTLTCANAQRSM